MTSIQIIHLSDLHFGWRSGHGRAWRSRQLLSELGVHPKGLSLHDERAWQDLETALKQLPDSASQRLLLVTGDITTWGDLPDLKKGLLQVRALAQGIGANCYAIPGNHDLWNGDFPLLSHQVDLDENSLAVHDLFTALGLQERLVVRLSNSPAIEFTLGHLTSAISDRVRNMLARGFVAPDEIAELVADTKETTAAENAQDPTPDSRPRVQPERVRVIAMHHPVSDPASTTRPVETLLRLRALENPRDVTTAACEGGVQMILAGHAHAMHPPAEDFPNRLPPSQHRCKNCKLAVYQGVAGSATQELQVGRAVNAFTVLEVSTKDGAALFTYRTFYRSNGLRGFKVHLRIGKHKIQLVPVPDAKLSPGVSRQVPWR